MAANTGGRRCRPHYRTPLRFDTEEALREHRDLEYLRAAAEPRFERGHCRRVRERARKLDDVAHDYVAPDRVSHEEVHDAGLRTR